MAGNSKPGIWKLGIVRWFGEMFKTNQKTYKYVHIPEEGVIRYGDIPLATGRMSMTETKSSWAAIHKLKVRIASLGIDVFFLCDRCYIPLNPCDTLTKEEIKRLIPLKTNMDANQTNGAVADASYDVSFAGCAERNKIKNAHKLLNTILYASIVITSVIVLIVLVKGRVTH
jgi:hypothetical protein